MDADQVVMTLYVEQALKMKRRTNKRIREVDVKAKAQKTAQEPWPIVLSRYSLDNVMSRL